MTTIRAAVRQTARALFAWNTPRFLAALFTALWLAVCLPANDLFYGKNVHMPYKPTFGLLAVFLLGLTVFYPLYGFLKDWSMKQHPLPDSKPWKRMIRYAIVPAIAAYVAYKSMYPGIFTVDSLSQLRQAMGEVRYNAWHPLGHTFTMVTLPWLLTGQIAAITITQLLLVVFTYAYMYYILETLGVNRRLLAVLNALIVFIPTNLLLSVSVWKDIPFTCLGVILTARLILLHRSGGKLLEKRSFVILTSVVMAALLIMRLNGLVLAVLLTGGLFVCYRKNWRKLLPMPLIAISVYVMVQVIGFGILEARPNNPGIPYRWFTQISAGIVAGDGDISEDEKAELETIVPLEAWKKYYNPYINDPLMNVPEYRVLDNIAAHKGALIRTTLSLALKNPKLALKTEARITTITWQILPQGPATITSAKNKLDDYGLQIESSPSYEMIWSAHDVTKNNKLLAVFCVREGVYLLIALFLLLLTLLRKRTKAWLCFMPVLLNVASMWISIPAQDYRYVYLTVMACPLLLFWTLSGQQQVENAKQIAE